MGDPVPGVNLVYLFFSHTVQVFVDLQGLPVFICHIFVLPNAIPADEIEFKISFYFITCLIGGFIGKMHTSVFELTMIKMLPVSRST